MDNNVIEELMNKGIITQVGINKSDMSMDELINKGCATKIGSKVVYDKVVTEQEMIKSMTNEFLTAVSNGGNVTLPCDIVMNETIVIDKDVTIDLNGHNILTNSWVEDDNTTNSYSFRVVDGSLTINGNGKITTSDADYSMCIWLNGGDVTINGGHYVNSGSSCDLVYLSNKGTLTINDGRFIASDSDERGSHTLNKRNSINIKDSNRSTCKVYVKGGTFLGFNPADNKSEGNNTNFVAEGYQSVEDGLYYVVKPL